MSVASFARPALRRLRLWSLALVALFWVGQAAAGTPGLDRILASRVDAGKAVVGIAMLGHVPTDRDVAALKNLGLVEVQPLRQLPIVLVKGTVAQFTMAVLEGFARDVYPDQRLRWDSAESTAAMRADQTRALGFTGDGVGIAIVDSGIDATHPVLMSRVVHNVRVYSPEYLCVTGISDFGIVCPPQPALVVSFDALPYNNTDTIGHGTHVAGLAAGDGTGNPELIGVAPGAKLVGYSTGEVLFIITALAAYDDILAHHQDYNIRVINNSWGSGYSLFNPDDPINVATKAAHDAGITVVFSAGNSATEMSTGPNEMAPWVIGVGSATVSKQRSDFSSGGLKYDNTRSAPIPADGHLHFDGDGLGLTHADVSAPGSNIVGPGTPTGLVATPGTPPGGSATLSGTSMAAPHISGLAAVLLQANPALTPDQVREAIEVTSVAMRDRSAYWQSGFGFADAKAAVDLVRRADFSQSLLDQLEAKAAAKVRGARDYKVLASDHWMFSEGLGSVGGLVTKTFTFNLKHLTEAIRGSIAFSADLAAGLDENLLFEWDLELFDPDGNSVATSELISGHSVGVFHADFKQLGITPKLGQWSVVATGQLHVSEPSLLWGPLVTVAVTQLKSQVPKVPAGPVFTPSGSLKLGFTGGGGQLTSPEGCSYDVTGVSASLTVGPTQSDGCNAGTVGYLVNYALSQPATFVSEPLKHNTVIGGDASLLMYLSDLLQPAWSLAFGSGVSYALDAVDDSGTLLASIAGGEMDGTAEVGPTPIRGDYPFTVPATKVPKGARLRLQLSFSGVYASTMRLMWDGQFGDSALQLTTGTLSPG